MTMRTHALPVARRALRWAAVVLAVGAAACSASPTAPNAAPDGAGRAGPASALAKQHPGEAATAKRRGGYNVVAD